MGKSAPQESPMQGYAAIMQAQTGQQWLQFSREFFGKAMQRQEQFLDPIIKRASDLQLEAQANANRWSAQDRARYKNTFLPLQDKFIRTAEGWDSPERQAKVAAEAKADVIANADAQRQQMARTLAAQGVNPASGRYQGIERQAGVETGLAAAGAQNMARNQARREAIALRGDALNIGAGLPSQSIAAMGAGVGAGSAAMNGNIANQNTFMDAGGIMDRGFNGAMMGWKGTADSLNDMYKNRLAAWQQEQSGMGSLFGGLGQLGGMIFSDENLKQDKTPVRTLDAVKNMRIEKWRYIDGVADGGEVEHIGTYAQDFKRETGLGDGHTIHLGDALGVTMGAVKELAAEVERLKAAPMPMRTLNAGKRSRAKAQPMRRAA